MARPRSDIAPRILHAARERFLHDGVDGASLREIAGDAGTSIGMVYYYHPTKDDLFLAVVEETYAGFLADLEIALAPDAPVEERIRRLYARIGAMSDAEFTVIRLVVREVLVSSARRERIVERFSVGHLPLVFRTILDGIDTGEISAERPPLVLAVSVFALGFAPQVVRRLLGGTLLGGMQAPEPETLASTLADVLFRGIGVDREGAEWPRDDSTKKSTPKRSGG